MHRTWEIVNAQYVTYYLTTRPQIYISHICSLCSATAVIITILQFSYKSYGRKQHNLHNAFICQHVS